MHWDPVQYQVEVLGGEEELAHGTKRSKKDQECGYLGFELFDGSSGLYNVKLIAV